MKVIKKDRMIKIAKVVLFIIILIICITILSEVLKRKYQYRKMSDFFTQTEDFDVLFFGNSHMYTVVQPMQLWEEYGIVSYNMGQTESTVAISYYNLLLACKTHKPKLVVLDGYTATNSKKVLNKVNSLHNTFDPYPLSVDKFLAIKDLCDEDDLLEKEMEFMFNFSIYHNRWKELTSDDFNLNGRSFEKGSECRIGFYTQNMPVDYDSIEMYQGEETVNIKYLRKMIEYCKENDIEILITYTPFPTSETSIAESKYLKTICDEYNINYVNLFETSIVNRKIDWYDTNHVNQSGARKVTNYIGKYIMENYKIDDQRNNEKYSFWHDDYKDYVEFKLDKLEENENDINNYLMMLYGENDFNYKIVVSNEIKNDEKILELLKNLDNQYEINDEEIKSKDETKIAKIIIYRKTDNSFIKEVWF